MRILNIICSYNTPNLTRRVYNELKANKDAEIIVLENSDSEDKMFKSPETKDLGRENVGFGGMHDWIWRQEDFKKYDFVAIYNNDVFGIPNYFLSRLTKYLDRSVGIAAPALNDDGTGWQHMRTKGDWYREAIHVEDAIGIFNTNLFDVFKEYSPMDFFGILDISLCLLSNREGYRNIIIDALSVQHMLAGARKESGVYQKYISESNSSLHRWHNNHPDLKKMYEEYIKKYDGVSVIIPNYNHNHLLERAIKSVLEQPITTEIIVVDDCSPDQDYKVLDKYPVKLLQHKVNKGLAQSRNTGISNSFHEWILPLDADDALAPRGLSKLFDNRNADIICGYLEHFTGGELRSSDNITKEKFFVDNQLVGTTLYHKDVWRNINGYWSDHHTFYEDWDFWGRASMRGYKFNNINELVYYYQGGSDGMCARLGKNRNANLELVSNHIKEYDEWIKRQTKYFNLSKHGSA